MKTVLIPFLILILGCQKSKNCKCQKSAEIFNDCAAKDQYGECVKSIVAVPGPTLVYGPVQNNRSECIDRRVIEDKPGSRTVETCTIY